MSCASWRKHRCCRPLSVAPPVTHGRGGRWRWRSWRRRPPAPGACCASPARSRCARACACPRLLPAAPQLRGWQCAVGQHSRGEHAQKARPALAFRRLHLEAVSYGRARAGTKGVKCRSQAAKPPSCGRACAQVSNAYLSTPQAVEYPTTNETTSHMYYYPPVNQVRAQVQAWRSSGPALQSTRL